MVKAYILWLLFLGEHFANLVVTNIRMNQSTANKCVMGFVLIRLSFELKLFSLMKMGEVFLLDTCLFIFIRFC